MDRASSHDGKQSPPEQAAGLAHYLDDLVLRVENYRHRSALSAVLLLVVGMAVGAAWWVGRGDEVSGVEASIPFATTVVTQPLAAPTPLPSALGGQPEVATGSDAAPASVDIVVHVSGAIRAPGLVRLPEGSRVADAVEAAGGPSVEGDIHRLNLATLLVDGTQIVVPAEGEEKLGPLIRLPGAAESGGTVDGQPSTGQGLIDLNDASISELETLPGVGPATASAIAAWRQDNGPFYSVDDLDEVPGIGPAKLEALRDLITT